MLCAARPALGYYGGPGYCHQDNDVTVVNNYSVEFNGVDYNASGNSYADWSGYDNAYDDAFDL